MSKTHWLLVALVAAMVCNGNCRPRELEHKNIYPVYRSEKQLQLDTPNRYEKQYKDDSVEYHRIDIPHDRVDTITHKNTVIDYVPVALTIKRPGVKIWPSDQNGIESSDDLSLYNIYTNNINPLNYMTTPNYEFQSHTKPNIHILEITTQPFNEYSTVYTRPIQVLERPPPAPPPLPPSPPYTYPTYIEIPQSYPNPIYNPPPTQTLPPIKNETQTTTLTTTSKPKPTTPAQQQTTPKLETTTKKRKKPAKCPNVSVAATTLINNSNKMKEGCQDINIQISTNINNSNTATKPNTPTNSSIVVVQNNPQNGVFGIFDFIWSILSRIFSFAFSNSSPIFTGLSALIFPWLFPQLLLQRQNQMIIQKISRYR